MIYGLWFMVYGLWFMVYGLWFKIEKVTSELPKELVSFLTFN